MNGVGKDTFRQMDSDSKLNVLFDYVHDLHEGKCLQDEKIEKLENRKRFDTTTSAVSGFIGGIVAVIGKWVLFKDM